jgi:hypothetical protein
VSGVLRSLDGKKAEAPSTLRIILGVGSERLLQFSLWYNYRGAELLTLLF